MYHQSEAMMSLLARYQWFKYSIIVTDFSGSNEFIKAAETLQNNNVLKQNFEILSVVKLRIKKGRIKRDEIIKRFKFMSSETRVILLHCHM
jgi:hypothetical protein